MKRSRADYMRSKRTDMKLAALRAYSPNGVPRCACPNCPEHTNPHVDFLTLDHIGGGGVKHHQSLGGKERRGASMALYYWLRDNGYPTGYRVLCVNCNFAIGVRGECPHARDFQGGKAAD